MRFADMGPFQFTFSDYMYELLGIKVVIIKGITENCINRNTDGMLSKSFIYQLMHKRIALKRILKYTLKQFLHVSVQSPSSGSALFELAKVIIVKIIN